VLPQKLSTALIISNLNNLYSFFITYILFFQYTLNLHTQPMEQKEYLNPTGIFQPPYPLRIFCRRSRGGRTGGEEGNCGEEKSVGGTLLWNQPMERDSYP
jgi:hypothetical protein